MVLKIKEELCDILKEFLELKRDLNVLMQKTSAEK